ncbi:MAG: Bax inhibitor-1 family protein, partial [Rhodospirillales bacterium]
MAFDTNRMYAGSASRTMDRAAYDAGLRSYMLSVYNYMASGLALTGIVAYIIAATPALYQPLFGTPLKWVVMLAPLGLVFFFSFKLESMKASTAHTIFWVFAGLMGASMATVFLAFTGASVARVFFITAGTFAAMSL